LSVDAVVPTLSPNSWHRTVETLKGSVDNIIVVASGQDKTPRENRDDVFIIRREEQLPFGEACRIGVEQSDAGRILFINDDAYASSGAVDCMKQSTARIVGARLVYPNGRIQHGGGSFLPGGLPYHLHRGMPADFALAGRTYTCPWITFAAALVDRNLWNELDGFDRLFKNGYEDVDFCLRAKELGASIEYVGGALFGHDESTTINSLGLNQEVNWEVFQEMWVANGRLWNTVKGAMW